MKRLLLLVFAAAIASTPVLAQGWEYAGPFPPAESNQVRSTHGLAVDPDGKVWVQPYYPSDSIDVDGTIEDLNVLYVYDADGSPQDTIRYIDYADGTTPRDTLGGFISGGAYDWLSGRGLGTDCEGNILVSQWFRLYKLDYETYEGLARVIPGGGSLSEATSDSQCNVYVTNVAPGNPIRIYEPNDFAQIGTVVDAVSNFTRDLQVTPDGLTLFETDFENPYTIIHTRPDAFTPFTDSVGVTLRGMRVESATIQPVTNYYWFSSGDPLSGANEDPEVETNWSIQTWYAFTLEELLANEVPTPVDSIKWDSPVNNPTDETVGPRPRALAFSPDGMTAYVGAFNQDPPSIQKFIFNKAIAVEPNGTSTPDHVALAKNYPNPFSGSTEIEFGLPSAGHAALRVYDVLGREVAVVVDEELAARTYTASFDASGLAPGTYLYVLELDGQRVSSNRMTLTK